MSGDAGRSQRVPSSCWCHLPAAQRVGMFAQPDPCEAARGSFVDDAGDLHIVERTGRSSTPVTWVHAQDCPTLNGQLPGVFDNLCACQPTGYAVTLPSHPTDDASGPTS